MDLKTLRRKIDRIDTGIVEALNERARISVEVGQIKSAQKAGIYAPEREREVFSRIKALNKGPMTDAAFEAVYREIMSSSIALEKPLSVAYLGGEGSNSYTAARRKFGAQAICVAASGIEEVFHKVEHEECDHGIVPIENSVEGTVTHTADVLTDSSLQVCAQITVKITHNLMANGPLDRIRKVYSNPQVLGQCRNWLLANLPPDKVAQVSVAATTDAARIAVTEKGSSAIAPIDCARIYGLKVLKTNIQDIAHNSTRFFVIGPSDSRPTGNDRTSIVFSIKDRPGVLYAMLAPFAKNGINLTKIESRPIKKKAWDYYFFVDLVGHREETKVKNALKKLEGMCKFLKVLGSYPA
ncbi:MAG: prephenate dehydratase [Elusimicrobia bacterium]|nr:prephenate dehydratase [Elusimicrobiota bacterium]